MLVSFDVKFHTVSTIWWIIILKVSKSKPILIQIPWLPRSHNSAPPPLQVPALSERVKGCLPIPAQGASEVDVENARGIGITRTGRPDLVAR